MPRTILAVILLSVFSFAQQPPQEHSYPPGSPLDLVQKGQKLSREGKQDEALALYRQAMEKLPDLYEAHLGAGMALDLKGDYAEARKELQKAIDHAGPETMAQALRSMAISYAFEGNAGQVAKYEKQVFDDRIAHTEWLAAATVCNELARMYLEMGDSNNAYKWYKKGYDTMLRTKDMSDADKNLWLFRWESAQARVAARRGKATEAQQHVTAAKAALDKANNPEQAQFYPYIVGYVAFYSGDYKTAIEQLQKASQEDALNLAMLAQSYEKSGDAAKAKEYYQKTLNVNTHNPTNAFARPLARKKLASEP
jgi:tetratricopeptide (TPR) repeat protein